MRERSPGGSWVLPVAVAATAVVGGLATRDAATFYGQLDKAPWAPPAAAFGPVWSTLFVLMAVAAVLVWRKPRSPQRRWAIGLFVAQLLANAGWSWLFFGARLGGPALAELIVMWLLVAASAWAFWRLRPVAGALMLPTLVWVSFAGVLNLSVWLRNPQWLA